MNKSLARNTVKIGMLATGLVLLAAAPAQAAGGHGPTTSGNYGVGNGNQVVGTVQAPINVCGNSIAGLGVANSSCHGGATANLPHHHNNHPSTSDNYGVLNGNQVVGDVQIPINVCGNSIAILGLANSGCHGGATAK